MGLDENYINRVILSSKFFVYFSSNKKEKNCKNFSNWVLPHSLAARTEI
jgi:hypothetical protein